MHSILMVGFVILLTLLSKALLMDSDVPVHEHVPVNPQR